MTLCTMTLWWYLMLLSSAVLASNEYCTGQQCVEEAGRPVVLQHGISRPGFRAAITSKGLIYLHELLIPLLKKELVNLEIPEMSGKADVTVTNVKYKFKKIRLTEVNIQSSSLESDPKMGLTLKLDDISLRVDGNWWYRVTFITDDGSVRIKADGVSLIMGILLDANEQGHPILHSTSCHFKVGDISVKFKGGASWLLNLFTKYVEGKIKDALNSKICDMASNYIKKTVNKALSSFPVTVPIDDRTKLSYALLKKPSFTSSMITTDHKGEFFSSNSPGNSEIPFSPSPLSPLSSLSPPLAELENRMVYLWVTDYVANSAAFVYMSAGLLSYNVTPEMIGDSVFKLDTGSFSQIIPKLNDAYPNKPLILGVRSTDDSPAITITPQGANLLIPGALDFYVTDNEDVTLTFTLGIMVSLDIQAWIEGNEDNQLFIKANATYIDAEVSVLDSHIGDIGDKAVANVWNGVSFLCQFFLMPPINKKYALQHTESPKESSEGKAWKMSHTDYNTICISLLDLNVSHGNDDDDVFVELFHQHPELAALVSQTTGFTNKGFPIPMVKGVVFVNPKLSLGEGYVLIETDIKNQQ